jgi:hypothetical protein
VPSHWMPPLALIKARYGPERLSRFRFNLYVPFFCSYLDRRLLETASTTGTGPLTLSHDVPFTCVQFPLYMVMVFDKWSNGVPIAFIIMKRNKQIDLSPWMTELKRKAVGTSLEWRPIAFIVDNAQAEINTIG